MSAVTINNQGSIPNNQAAQNAAPQQSTWLGRQATAANKGCSTICSKIEYAAKKTFDFCATQLDPKTPNNVVQDKLDAVGSYIEKKFAPLTKFNDWLNCNGGGAWYKQLAIFLAKLPLRAIRNIVQALYDIVKNIVYFCVHPIKAIQKLLQTIKTAFEALGKPETWTKLGAGMLGASLGQAVIPGNPAFFIGAIFGALLMAGGMTAGAIQASLAAKDGQKSKAALNNMIFQAKALPEAILTGFGTGLIIAGIQHGVNAKATVEARDSLARNTADRYVRTHRLPRYENVTVKPSGDIVVEWATRKPQIVGQFKNMDIIPSNPMWGMNLGGVIATKA